MKFLPLIWRNLLRRKFRTTVTLLAVITSFLLYGVLTIVRLAFSAGVDLAGVDRLMMLHKVAIILPLPISYQAKIQAVPGVKLVTYASWFGGIYQDPSNNVFQFAVEPEPYMALYPEFKLPPEQMKAWLADRQGAVVGRDVATRLGWTIGDRIPIMGTFNRPAGGDGVTWHFNIAGIYDGDKGVDKTQFLIRHDYLDESRRGQGQEGLTGWYMIKIDDPSRAAEIASTIDALFANSSYETKTATEKAMIQGWANQIGNIGTMVTLIATVVVVMILVVVAVTMGLAVQERTRELAAQKAMGFPDGLILALVLAESLTITIVGGGIGLGLGKIIEAAGDPTGGYLPVYMFPTRDLLIGFGLAALVGLLAGAMPAMSAMRLRITDALRRS